MVGVEYFFITRGGVKRRSELEHPPDEDGDAALETVRKAGKIVKFLFVRCSKSKCVFAHVVPCKGVEQDYYVVGLIVKDFCWLGFTTVILKADNENATRALLARVVDRATATILLLEQISLENAAKYDSQSNGITEVGVAFIRGIFRTLKLCLEARIERYIPVDHALVP